MTNAVGCGTRGAGPSQANRLAAQQPAGVSPITGTCGGHIVGAGVSGWPDCLIGIGMTGSELNRGVHPPSGRAGSSAHFSSISNTFGRPNDRSIPPAFACGCGACGGESWAVAGAAIAAPSNTVRAKRGTVRLDMHGLLGGSFDRGSGANRAG